MLYRPLGQSGIQASVVGLGSWPIGGWMWGGTDQGKAVRAIQASVDAGTAVSLSRWAGQKHFPSDIFVGSVLGGLIGNYVATRAGGF
jgi:methylglyoxal reductase